MNKTIIITGASGFIGHHFLDHIIYTDWKVVCIDSFDQMGSSARIDELKCKPKDLHFIYHDLNAPIDNNLYNRILDICDNHIDYIVNFASDSSVERSVSNPLACWSNNCNLIANILEFARKTHQKVGIQNFLHVSTDEVYGDSNTPHNESSKYTPSNTYAASKAAQETLCHAYHRTYDLPVVITNCVNNYGYRQHKEKFIPLLISKIRDNEEITIYSTKDNKIGERYYLHAIDHSAAIIKILIADLCFDYEMPRFNIGSDDELNNLEMAELIARIMNVKLFYKIEYPKDRPGYDACYKIYDHQIRTLGWSPYINLEDGLRKIINHSLKNPHWLK